MKTWHKGLIIGGTALAVLVPAGLVAADQMGHGNGQGRGNGTQQQNCDREDMQARNGAGTNGAGMNRTGMNGSGRMNGSGQMNGQGGMQARDGSGPRHMQNTANTSPTTTTVNG